MIEASVAHPSPAITPASGIARAIRDRAERGPALYGSGAVERLDGKRFLVASSTGRGVYAVDYAEETCTCPDFVHRGEACKHVFAVGVSEARRQARARRDLRVLEDRYRNDFMSIEERCELLDRIGKLKGRAGKP